jgi:hypothetical protein
MKSEKPKPIPKPMKKPIRFLCAAAVLFFVWADGLLESDIANQTAYPSGETILSGNPNTNARAGDPARALAQAFPLELRNERESRIRDLLCAWAGQDSEAALQWVSALENSSVQGSTRSTVCLAVAEKGSLECLTMQWCEKPRLASGLEPGTVQGEAAMAVLHQWALQDSPAALRWAEAFPQPTLRERALAEISNLRNPATSTQEVH